MRSSLHSSRTRRGTVAVAVLLVLLLTSLFIIGIVSGASRDQDLSGRRMETVRAFYAAEAGTNMALREIELGVDEDGDGGVGTISDDANDANDPALGDARVHTNLEFAAGVITLHSRARAGTARRDIEVELEY